jgi:hypothetical protein
MDAGARPAELEIPGLAEPVIGGRVKRVGIGGVHDDIDAADRPALDDDVEDFSPRPAAINRLIEAPVGIFAVEVPQGRDVDDIGIGRMDDDAADMMRFGKSHVLPGLAGIGGFIDAVPPVSRAGIVGLARAHPEDVGVDGPRRCRRWRRLSRSRRSVERWPLLTVFHSLPEPVAA